MPTGISAGVSNFILRVEGSSRGDRIDVQVFNDNIRVIGTNSVGVYDRTFPKNGVGGIVVQSRGGNDTINILDGNATRPLVTTLRGGDGNDTISGGRATDVIEGGAGHDDLRGNNGNDRIFGQNGNDTLRPGTGNDQLYGGTGSDKIYLTNSGPSTFAFGGTPESDTFVVGTGTPRAFNIAKIRDRQANDLLRNF